ncbi:MAG: glucose-6-phosphate isomerase, partial [Candidatus Bipolaricaulota bacterium]|nr:glucose-6-phosphate isomerase [Candidatus Bipolaricaulota bacterium]
MEALCLGDRQIHPQVRTLHEMQSVIFDREWLRTADLDQPLYLMYRDCTLPHDQKIAQQLQVRYDITVLLPVRLGREYNKTKGHYHSEYQPGLCYHELYQVLEGQAHMLLQKRDGDKITDIVLVIAHEGETVLVPPNYGHITINPTEKTVKMANWVSTKVESFYEPFEQMGGGAYFELITSPLPSPQAE